ncbi:hypothetical protein SDC9_34803 [bioreactor metagenome]|uniref:Uncharacterized protein n=1 Tax=bioreactor metagenome TaxID=1076179 RepID=A0A644VBR0_9ZZZZ
MFLGGRARRSARRHRGLAAIVVEAAAGLAAKPARLDVFHQQRAGAVLGVRQPVVQHVHDRQAGVEADEVGELERAHRVVRAQLHRHVDRLHVADAFVKRVDRLVDHRDQDAVHDEGREVLGRRRGLAELRDDREHRLIGRIVGGDAADQLDELHHRHRVHEVHAHEPLGPVGLRGEPGDRDRRGVRGEDRRRFQMRHQGREDLILDLFALGRCLDHQVGLAEVGQGQRGGDAGKGGGLVLGGDLLARDLAVQVLLDGGHRLVEAVLRDVVQQDIVTREGEDMGNAVAHLACANDTYGFDRHVGSFPITRGQYAAAQQRAQGGSPRRVLR